MKKVFLALAATAMIPFSMPTVFAEDGPLNPPMPLPAPAPGPLPGLAPVPGPASASMENQFEAKYQQNQNTEASLLSTAQTNSSVNTDATALLNTVQSIGSQVSALYTAEQTLVNDKSAIPQMTPAEQQQMQQLNHERNQILAQSDSEWKLVVKFDHNKHEWAIFEKAWVQHQHTQKKLLNVDKLLRKAEQHDGPGWRVHPYDKALPYLQQSILRLQQSEIHYTQEAIALENAANESTSGNTYGTSTSIQSQDSAQITF